MKRNSKWNWLMALTAVAILSFFAAGNSYAWGPLAQSAIAQVVQRADGMPPATASRNFVIETTMPKVFEYTSQSYANLSYDYTDVMIDNLHGMNDYCQALAWGVSQTAEKTGDNVFFHRNSPNAYARWLNELLCEALLTSIESPYQGTGLAEVAVMAKLVSDTSADYTAIFGGDSFSGQEAILAASLQANVLVGELAVVDSPIFQGNAKRIIDVNNWVIAMDKSVADAVEYAVNSTQAASVGNWMVGDASDYGAQLLGRIGSLLVATGDASIAAQHNQGLYSYRVSLNTDRVNEITVQYLFNISRDLDEHPILRHMASSLHNLMTEDTLDFSFVGQKPAGFGQHSFTE
jgi:hypothetical protein